MTAFGLSKGGGAYGRRATCVPCITERNKELADARRGRPARGQRAIREDGRVQCRKCQEFLPASEFRLEPRNRDGLHSHCRTCDRQYARDNNRAQAAAWAEANPEAARRGSRRSAIGRRYGLTPEDYEELLRRQGGRCAICGADNPQAARRRFFSIDHDHITGAVRGLLCVPCNTGIGSLNDDPDLIARALAYVLAARDGGSQQ